MTDVATKPNEWHTEFPVQWTAVQPEPASDPTPALSLIPGPRTSPETVSPKSVSPEAAPSVVVTIPAAAKSPIIPKQRTPAPSAVLPAPARSRRTTVLVAEGALALAVAGAGIGVAATSGGSTKTVTLHGAVTIAPYTTAGKPNYYLVSGGKCAGLGQYADLVSGAAVSLVNAQGATIVRGVLGQSTLNRQVGCQLTWQVAGVAKQQVYRVVIARRGLQTFTSQQIANGLNTDLG